MFEIYSMVMVSPLVCASSMLCGLRQETKARIDAEEDSLKLQLKREGIPVRFSDFFTMWLDFSSRLCGWNQR